MRSGILRWSFVFLILNALVLPAGALAQDDGFDDEFEEEPAPAASPARRAQPAASEDEEASEDEGDEEATEPAGDDEESEAEETHEEEESAAAPTPEADEAIRNQRLRMHNTIGGPTGGIRVVDAWGGAAQSFRLQLETEFFFASDFLVTNDSNDHVGGTLSMSWAITDFLEAFASLSSYANSNDQERPRLFQVLGDTTLGAKAWYAPLPWLAVGGDLTLALLNAVGDIGLIGKSTSLGIRLNTTADLRRLPNPVPFIARFNLQYYLDNSSQLIADVEQRRYAALPSPRAIEDEDRHLVSRVERFALGVNRTDRITLSLGVEAPLEAAHDFYISPMLEWQWMIPVNRQSYNCLFVRDPSDPSSPAPGTDGCLDKQGLASFPMRLTLGVRVLPPVKGFAAFLAADIGLTGVSTFVREVAPQAPYNIMIGASYAYDTREVPPPEPVVREVERRVEVRIPPPPKGRVRGTIIEQGAGTPVQNAVVRFQGRDVTPLFAGDDGHFTSYEFDPGEVLINVSAPEYRENACNAVIAAEGGDVEVRCELEALPRRGTVNGHVVDTTGAAVGAARIALAGPEARTITADASGAFTADNLVPGTYNVRVEADNYLIKTDSLTIVARQTATPQLVLVPRPRRSLVQIRAREIVIRQQINFATDSAEILDTSTPLMSEIADVLMRSPQIRLVEIQGHTDNVGQATHNMELSQRRADSVRDWLVRAGVEASRLEAHGYGQTRPRVPNITAGNRARNRRVQFIIKEQASAEPAAAEQP